MDDLVSVIMPTRNYGQFIADAILSVVNQDYKNVELIVINDGSTDNTNDVVNSIDFKNRKLQYLSSDGVGAAASRNFGLKQSGGDFVLFLDADDILVPGSISLLMSSVHENSADIVVGAWENFNTNMRGENEYLNIETIFTGNSFANIIYRRPVISSFILRKQEILFDERLVVSEVLDFIFNYGCSSPKVKLLTDKVVMIRQHSTSNRLSVENDHFEPVHRLNIFMKWKSKYDEIGILDRELRAAIDYNLLHLLFEIRSRGGSLKNLCEEVNLDNLSEFIVCDNRVSKLAALVGVRPAIEIIQMYRKIRYSLKHGSV